MSERCLKHTKYECFVKHFWQIIIIIIILLLLSLLLLLSSSSSYMLSLSVLFFDGTRLWRGLQVWQISGDVKNKRNEIDENDDNTFVYIYIYIIYLFVCLFLFIYLFIYIFIYLSVYICIYLIIYLFIISFKLLKL